MSNVISSSTPAHTRIASIDALRGFTILVMIFVNDLASVAGVPSWMKHLPSGADGMTFVDVVFPAFLFIVGMSIPFALGGRLDRGVSAWIVGRHVLTRTLGLLVIGVFMVNSEPIWNRSDLGTILWIFFMYMAVILVWNQIPREPRFRRKIAFGMRVGGIILLAVLAVLYRGEGQPGFIEMRPSWWGILGLIGWAYFMASMIYIFFRKQPYGMMGMTAVLYCVYFAAGTGFFDWIPLIPKYVDIGGMLGSHAAIVLSGVILGMILSPGSPIQSHADRIRWSILYGLGLWAAGVMLHSLRDIDPMFIIDKNSATPPWCLISSAITVWVWIAIYWLMDVQGWTKWTSILSPAGQNPLFAYILAPILYILFALVGISGFYFDTLGGQFGIGFVRALVFTFMLTWLTGFLYRRGVRLRL